MKGVMLGINPRATVVDLTHEIPPGDIRAGAFALRASYRFFPEGTVHLAVVDPGVGSPRNAVAVKTAKYCFVGPDNGVLSWALTREKVIAVREILDESYFLRPVSRTFHGRDIFAPAAAHLSRGLPLHKLGPALEDLIRLSWPEPQKREKHLEGEVIYVDHFGNVITNITAADLEAVGPGADLEIVRGNKTICDLAAFYGAVPFRKGAAVLGSSGFLEIAINGGNASEELKIRIGTAITVRRRGSSGTR